MLVKLNEIANITMGQSPNSKFYNSDKIGLPFLQGRTTFGRMFPYYDTWTSQYNKIANKDDILMSVRAPVGDLNFCQTQTAIGRGIASIKGTQISTKYIYYLLLANKEHICTRSTGSVYDSISKSDLENLVFDIHDLDIQLHIVNTNCFYSSLFRMSIIFASSSLSFANNSFSSNLTFLISSSTCSGVISFELSIPTYLPGTSE